MTMMKQCLPRRGYVASICFGFMVPVIVYIFNANSQVSKHSVQRVTSNVFQIFQTNANISSDIYEPKWTDEYLSSLCIGGDNPDFAEDLLCLKRPDFLPNYKNPCWKDESGRIMCIPYFHLLGADKCGSTDLFDRILKHPEMEPAYCMLGKECYYWCWRRYGIWMENTTSPHRSFNDYVHDEFRKPAKAISKEVTNGYHNHVTDADNGNPQKQKEKAIRKEKEGEGTPMDLWDFRGWPLIPQNEKLEEPFIMNPHLMKYIYPNPKFIIILREPAERLYSDYYFIGDGDNPEEFHTDTVKAIEMVESCARNRSMRLCLFDVDMYRNLPMRIHISCYSVMVREWLRVFPRDSFLILRNEDYGEDIRGHMELVFNFLNMSILPDAEMDELSGSARKHITRRKSSRPMFEETRILLDKFYAPFTEELARLLKDDRFLWLDKK